MTPTGLARLFRLARTAAPAAGARLHMPAVGFDDRLSLVDHLDELRSRLIVSIALVLVAFAVCFWQNHALLRFVDRPLAHQTEQQVRAGQGPLGRTYVVAQSSRDVAVQLRAVVGALQADRQPPATRRALRATERHLDRDIAHLSSTPQGDRPVTLGIGEPFTTTATVSLIFALIISLPVILWQAYAFLMPAVEPEQRRRLRGALLAVPLLFIAGVAFGYGVVLPAAVHFFQNFNSTQFNVLVQASQYYKFAATMMLAMGLLFQIPIAIVAVTAAGVVTPRQLRRKRRYAIGACAAIAAFLPGDLITMLLETIPLYLLFEASLIVATLADRRRRRRAAAVQQPLGA